MWDPCLHIAVVIHYTYNLQTPIQAVGGVIFFSDNIYIYIYIYYAVAYANITSLYFLDKLITVFCISTEISHLYAILSIYFFHNKNYFY